MDDFSYENLTSKFFLNEKLLASKSERIENCFRFVSEKISCTSYALKVIKKRIVSLELTFRKKWHESKCVAKRFADNNVEWLHKSLQVVVSKTYFLLKL